MAEATSSRGGSDRFLIAIAAGAVALIVFGIAVVLLVGRVAPPLADPTSPVGVVQTYVEALRSGDQEKARSLLSQSARQQLDRSRDTFPRYYESYPDRRVLIQPVSQSADRAEVKVTISTFSARSEPFSTSTYHREVQVFLVKEPDGWRINQPVEPYPFLY